MNIGITIGDSKRQTTAEEVFQRLQHDIISMQLAPGTKLSEVEVAKLYDVSRQPIREAFMRLGDLNLLQIRPQKATLVRKISIQDLENTRFIRAAVEVEVIRKACHVATDEDFARLDENLAQQRQVVKALDPTALRALDYEFHRLICQSAACLPAFKTITENKAHTDRICTLELADAAGMNETLEGHSNIIIALKKRDEELSVRMTRLHLAHLDGTIALAHQNHPDYFEV